MDLLNEAHAAVLWLAHQTGVRTEQEFFQTLGLALCGAWAVAAMGTAEAYFANLDRRNRYLLHEAEWTRCWWHYPAFPRFWVWQLLAFFLPIAICFELWWRCTTMHGKRSLKR